MGKWLLDGNTKMLQYALVLASKRELSGDIKTMQAQPILMTRLHLSRRPMTRPMYSGNWALRTEYATTNVVTSVLTEHLV